MALGILFAGLVAGKRYHLYRTVVLWTSEGAGKAKRRQEPNKRDDDEPIDRDLSPACTESKVG
jgi:hypothetical protein